MKAETLRNTRGDSHVLVDKMADSLAEVETETLGDTLSDAQTLVKSLANRIAA